jgi:hypothetical protein
MKNALSQNKSTIVLHGGNLYRSESDRATWNTSDNVRRGLRKVLLYADFTIVKTIHFTSKTVSLVPRAIFVNCCTFYVQAYYSHWSTSGDKELQYDKQIPTFVIPTVNQPCKEIPTLAW